MNRAFLVLLGLAALPACQPPGTIEGTRAEHITVDGRKFKLNVGPTGEPEEYRLLVVRDTLVIDPDPARESARAQEVAQIAMRNTCKGRTPHVLTEGLERQINYRVLFRCGG